VWAFSLASLHLLHWIDSINGAVRPGPPLEGELIEDGFHYMLPWSLRPWE